MVEKIELEIEETASLEKTTLDIGQGYKIQVEQVSEGIATGKFGDSQWVSLSDGENIYFFSSYEYEGMKGIIGETEAPFTILLKRIQKTSKKGNIYTIVAGNISEDTV
jgi:hypothetical protein